MAYKYSDNTIVIAVVRSPQTYAFGPETYECFCLPVNFDFHWQYSF